MLRHLRLGLFLLPVLAAALSGCVIYEEPPPYHHDWHRGYWR
jgi:outer membrane protein assembly factor BamE (lipoprotein component of BamABCDE complex)